MNNNYQDGLQRVLSHVAIMEALFENYESIYAIDVETSSYQCYHESDSFSALSLETVGDDFFGSLDDSILRTIYFEDRGYVSEMLSRENLIKGLERERYYSFVYRLLIDGEPLYHKIRATMEPINGRPYILLGVRNVDTAFRRDKAHAEELSSMHQKEKNHLEAVLASAAGYLEANLSKDLVLELSPYRFSENKSVNFELHELEKPLRYSDFERWLTEKLVVKKRDKYLKISNRDYLIGCYMRGEKRASVSFSAKAPDGSMQPCKKVFFLYQDSATEDIFAFCVIYDLTEQQRKEKELQELEKELQMSRIRNFTSQMQPHFLYNALGSIQEIILDDPEYASELIGDFTIHLRSCIRAMASDRPIPFTQELANIRAYTNIERMRLGDKLKIVYDIEPQDFSILPLSVQPLVENAIRHGVYQRGKDGGTVTIRTRELEEAWQITVMDDGVGFDFSAYQDSIERGERDSTGLKNIMFRLDKVMGAEVRIQSDMGVGTTITITIPKEGIQHESNNS
ncbi:MAG: histidine kinase [Oscillospiraceae bacterium]|nr:histidine kinase [Oscillospiraceae bacterium]